MNPAEPNNSMRTAIRSSRLAELDSWATPLATHITDPTQIIALIQRFPLGRKARRFFGFLLHRLSGPFDSHANRLRTSHRS